MHESGMMKDLMKQIESEVENQGGTRAIKVKVSIGILTQMSPQHFRGHFEQAALSTVAEHAGLEIDTVNDLRDQRALHVILESVEVKTQ